MKIALMGQAGSGKDFLAEGSIEKGYNRLAFGDAVKTMAKSMYSWLDDYGPNEKEQIQTVTTKFGKIIKFKPRDVWLSMNFLLEFDNNVFIDKFDELYKNDILENTIITDIRTQMDFDYCKEKGFIIIHIEPDRDLYEHNTFDNFARQSKDKCDYSFENTFNGTKDFLGFIDCL
jgi:dephospho-CoA kinase